MKQYQVSVHGREFDYYLFPYTDEGSRNMEYFVYSYLDGKFGDLIDVGDILPIEISVVDEPEPIPDNA